ncbi:MAG: STAS domain-containing protein [candidate division KSB1 bacterium]|nr:STAS domain-containing protein [candidate division KSB1 bacterium]
MLQARVKDGVLILRFDSRTSLTAENGTAFLEEGSRLLHTAPAVILDFANLEFVDSAGLRQLIALRKQARKTGKAIALARLRPPVREVFEVTRLTREFPIYADLRAALRALAGHRWQGGESNGDSLKIETKAVTRGVWIRATGCESLTQTNVSSLVSALEKSARKGKQIIADLRAFTHIDSAALSQLYGVYAAARQNGCELTFVVQSSLAAVFLAQVHNWKDDVVTDVHQAIDRVGPSNAVTVSRGGRQGQSDSLLDFFLATEKNGRPRSR